MLGRFFSRGVAQQIFLMKTLSKLEALSVYRHQSKMLSSKKLYLLRDFATGVYLSEPLSPPITPYPPPPFTHCIRVYSIVDRHRLDADPNPYFHFDADTDPDPARVWNSIYTMPVHMRNPHVYRHRYM